MRISSFAAKSVFSPRLAPMCVCLALALLTTTGVGAEDGAFTPTAVEGEGMRGFGIANLHPSRSAHLVVEDLTGFARVNPFVSPPVPPCSSYSIYLPDPIHFGSVLVSSREGTPVGALVRREWHSTGASVLNQATEPATDLVVPLVVKNYYDQTSLIAVLNTDPLTGIVVELSFYETGRSDATTVVPLTIGPGASVGLDLGKADLFSRVPDGFLGSMRVKSATEVAVTSDIDIGSSAMAVYSVEAVRPEAASSRLYVPLFRRSFYGTTGISVVNPGSEDVRVTVTFQGTVGVCEGSTYEQAATIPAFSSGVFYQGPGDVPVTGQTPLPEYCAGSAVIDVVEGEVLAIVNDAFDSRAHVGSTWPPTTSAAYRAVGVAQASREILIPLWRKQHLRADLTTGIMAMNLGQADADATIVWHDNTGTPFDIVDGSRSIPPGGSYVWYPPSIANLPDNSYGTANISSSEPLIAIVNEASLGYNRDSAIHVGLPCAETGPLKVAIP